MEVRTTTETPDSTGADTIAIGLFDGERPDGPLGELVDSGEAKAAAEKISLARSGETRVLGVGLGKRADFGAEGARRAAATALDRARELGSETLCWRLPDAAGAGVAAALVEGSLLAAYRFDRYKSDDENGDEPHSLVISAADDVSGAVAEATTVAAAVNAARDLQNAPPNDMTPTALGARARELAAEIDGLSADVEDRDGIETRGMGAFVAVARGSYEEPALITLRYDGPAAAGPVLGFVGKAVTFDTGGISIKPSAKMEEMKFDMSGGAAVIEAVGAIARLALPVRIVAVVGATENMPSGRSMRPGDIVTAMNGTTIEINNTDAEGRLVLSDCLAHAVNEGAERLIDLATLTGAIIVSLGSTHAGLFSGDDEWAAEIEAAGRACGEIVWRLPLHAEYADMIKGAYADIANVTESRKASSITAAEFLRRFTGDVPWAHVDIAGTAWDLDRPYARKGGAGFGVRLLVELARQRTKSG